MAGKGKSIDGVGPTLVGIGADKTDAIGDIPTQDSGETDRTGSSGQSTPEGGGGDYDDEIESALNLVGRVLGEKYELERLVGQGGMGAVYEARHLTIGSKVAIKVLFPERRRQRESLARFVREAQTAGTIGHTNIVKVFDLDKTDDGLRYLVMEYVEGRSLAEVIAAEGVMGPERVVAIAEQVLEALDAAHAQGIVHRDIKPENVMICEDAECRDIVRVLDFGISKIKPVDSDGQGLTMTGTVLGTPMYMAPEQARGEPDIDLRIDLYAVGVMMYVMLTGQPPFQASNYNALLAKILTETPPPISSAKPDLDYRLAKVVEKAMVSDRVKRFATAREFLDALRSPWLPTTSRKSSQAMKGGESPSRRRWLWGGLAIVALAIVVIAVYAAGALTTGTDGSGPSGDGSGHATQPSDIGPHSKVVASSSTVDAGQEDGASVDTGASSVDEMISVSVAAEPSTATIKLGGLLMKGNPVVKRYLRSDEPLAILIEARGFETHHEIRPRSTDIELMIELARSKDRPSKGRPKTGLERGDFKIGKELFD